MNFDVIIIIFFIGIFAPWLGYFFDMQCGNIHDVNFTEKTIKKLIVKENSFLRKIMPFKEIKGAVFTKFLYIRAVPLLLQTIIVIVSLLIFAIDQLIYDFIWNDIFAYYGMLLIVINTLYMFILIILARWLKI